MRIHSLHERTWPVALGVVGSLIDGLGAEDDRLWPLDRWPPLRLDSGLRPGSRGGHGPVRYTVSEYLPGRRLSFAFDPARGLLRGAQGTHAFEALAVEAGTSLCHTLEARAGIMTTLRWLLLVRPLHDALLRDALARAEAAVLSRAVPAPAWSWRVRLLRRLARRAGPRPRSRRSDGTRP
jgi:hypothetical protein